MQIYGGTDRICDQGIKGDQVVEILESIRIKTTYRF